MPDGVQQQDGQQGQSQGTALYETPFDPTQHVPAFSRLSIVGAFPVCH